MRQVRETLRDVQFLHNDQFFAAAQKKYVYIYDKRGIEVHCLKVRAHMAWLGAQASDFLPDDLHSLHRARLACEQT